MFIDIDCPRLGLSISRETITRHPDFLNPYIANSSTFADSIVFKTYVDQILKNGFIFNSGLFIRKDIIYTVRINCSFRFNIDKSDLTEEHLKHICFCMFDFMKECFFDYSKEDHNADLPAIDIHVRELEKYFASDGFNDLWHSIELL